MTGPTDTETSIQARNKIRDLLKALQPYVDDSTPQGALIQERDHYARMWDDVVQDVLKNLQSIRGDYAALRRTLDTAATAGSADTERVIEAIQTSTAKIISAIAPISVSESRKRKWWDIR